MVASPTGTPSSVEKVLNFSGVLKRLDQPLTLQSPHFMERVNKRLLVLLHQKLPSDGV